MGTSADPKPAAPMATPSYAAVAGGRSPPPGKKQGNVLSLHQSDDERNSPRRVFSIKLKADSTATTHPAPKENGSSADAAKPMQHHQKKGTMHLNKQQMPVASSAPNFSVADNGKPTMPAQQNNNAADSSQKEQHVQPTHSQKRFAAMTMTKAEKKKARKMAQQYQQDQTAAGPSSSTPKSTTTRDEDKSKASMDSSQVQNTPSASAAPVSSATDARPSGYQKPSTQSGTNKEDDLLASLGKQALYCANVRGETMEATIARQQSDITDIDLHLTRQTHENTILRAKIDSLENLLALKGQNQLEERLRKLEIVELEGKIKQLEAKCSSLEDEVGHLRPVLDAFLLIEKARCVREADFQAENAKLRSMIKDGVIYIADIWGDNAAAAFSNVANGNMGENECKPASPTTPSAVPCSPRLSKADYLEPAPGELNTSPKINRPPPQKDEKTAELAGEPDSSPDDHSVAGYRDTAYAYKDYEGTPSSTSESVVNKEDSIDYNTSKDTGSVFDHAKFEAKGTGSWADEVEQEESQQGQSQPSQDAARVDEKPQSLPEASREPPRKFQASTHPGGTRPSTDFQAPSGGQVSSLQSAPTTTPTTHLSGATPGGSKPHEEHKKTAYQEQKPGNQRVGTGRGDYAQKIQDLYVQRKVTKPYHNKSMNNNNNHNYRNNGTPRRDAGPSENKTEEDDEGWTSVKGKGKSGYQAKHMGSWRKQ